MTVEVAQGQETARQIEGYLRDNKLFYGNKPREDGFSSWMLSLSAFEINRNQHDQLTSSAPSLIQLYHFLSAEMIARGLADPSSRLREVLTASVPEETIGLWEKSLKVGLTLPFSSRPDMIIDAQGKMRIIEYNVDGGADKGNTLGVNQYSQKILGINAVGEGLASLFIEGISRRNPEADNLVVATILPDSYRTEYDAQNRYFAAFANELGRTQGLEWIAVKLSEIEIDGNGIYAYGSKRIDIVDREFKLPGFTNSADFVKELELAQVCLDGKAGLLGTLLPLSDKALLSVMFDHQYQPILTKLLGFSEDDEFGLERLGLLRDLHTQTQLLDPNREEIFLDGRLIRLSQLFDLDTDFPLVIKKTGDTEDTTGSKGVVISTDSKPSWRQALEYALNEPLKGGHYWIVQPLIESGKFAVEYIKNSRKMSRVAEAMIRFAPYFVMTNGDFELGNILVTAGTDDEVRKKSLHNIHGLRDNAYLAVSLGV
ncbi:hypothetical protein HYS93_02865 [Candidatus Daviesbacteria bacterium]|nr:hypothetical protein [Candidatus Daviesbacteria bacterium]